MSDMSRTFARFAASAITLFVVGSSRGPIGAQEAPAGANAATRKFAGVWYRNEQRGKVWVFLASGDLTVGPDALRFDSKELKLEIPAGRIRQVRMMKFEGEPTFRWVIVDYADQSGARIAAFRDAGMRAPDNDTILASIKAVAPSGTPPEPIAVAAETGPSAVSDDLKSYLGHSKQFTIDIPKDWFIKDQSAGSGDNGAFGVIVFSAESLSRRVGSVDEAMLLGNRLDSGELPSFFVDRHAVAEGMSCEGFSASAEKRALRASQLPDVLGKGTIVLAAPTVERVSLGRCQALKVTVHAQQMDGRPMTMLVYSVSDGRTAFDFALRSLDEFFRRNLPVFESSVQTVTLKLE